MTEEKKTRNRIETCAMCGEEVTRRKSVDISRLGRVCRSHRVPCFICGQPLPYAKAVQLINRRQLVHVCSHHPGIEAMVALIEEEPDSEESNDEDRNRTAGIPDSPPGDSGGGTAEVSQGQ